MDGLAGTLRSEGHYSEAEKLERQALDALTRLRGPEHPFTLAAIDQLARTIEKEGRYDEAEKLEQQSVVAMRRVLGPDHPDTADATYNLAVALAHNRRSEEAISVLREAIDHGLDSATDLAIATDPDLKPLRKDPRFKALVSYAQQRATSQKHN
jgi:tetratricopeptide (TPR) repeat protein